MKCSQVAKRLEFEAYIQHLIDTEGMNEEFDPATGKAKEKGGGAAARTPADFPDPPVAWARLIPNFTGSHVSF